MCWNSEGRARFEGEGERHLVSFYSELLLSQNLWRLGIQIPLKGEEVIELDYAQRKTAWVTQVSKQKDGQSRDVQFAAWQTLVEALSDFLILSVKVESRCRAKGKSGDWVCTVAGTDRHYEVRLDNGEILIEGQRGGDSFKLKASQLEEKQNYFQLVEVQHLARPIASTPSSPISAKFFIKECRSKAQ
ncbi:MAG: hypothetical protein HYV97_02900 [Bdellovibrio sp.]|nr:hypothetical protein [Bdellovibrio sp.]